MYNNAFYIIYPKGDYSRIKVVNISENELTDYALASRRSFSDLDYAEEYASDLARKNQKTFISSDGNAYLD